MTTLSSPALTPEVYCLTPDELRTDAWVLSPDLISRLGSVLEQHRSILFRDLGLPLSGPIDREFQAWCQRSGSTLFVLVSVLESVGRLDCLEWLHNDMEQNLMRLHLAIESTPSTGPISGKLPVSSGDKFQQITTNSQFTIREALERPLGGDLSRFEIIGPESGVTWDTKANKLRGCQLTLRHTRGSQTSSLDSETKVKELYSTSYETDVKKLYLSRNGTQNEGDIFSKGFSENFSLLKDKKGSKGEKLEFDDINRVYPYKREGSLLNATHVKQVTGSEETQLKNIADGDDFDTTNLKQIGSSQFETYVKDALISCSNNATPMDSTVQGDGEMGFSDSVIVEPRSSSIHMDTLNDLCSNTTWKFPISGENIQGQFSDNKPLPNKDLLHDPLPVSQLQTLSYVRSDKLIQSQVNVPNLSLLNPSFLGTSSEGSHLDRDLPIAGMSHKTNLSPVERKQNNLNYISVPTIVSSFQANFGAPPLSLAEKPHFGHPQISHEEGDRSISDNRILDRGNEDCYEGADNGGWNGQTRMEISDHQTLVKSFVEREAVGNAPPNKRQKPFDDCRVSDETCLNDNAALFTRESEAVVNQRIIADVCHMAARTAQPELDLEMVQHHQQDSSSISQEPKHRLQPLTDNFYRHTPPPPYLIKEPPFQPPPYSSVAQSVSRPIPHTIPSMTQFSSNPRPLYSNPQASRVDEISYTNVPGHLSAPANLPSQHGQMPSSVRYMTMAVTEPVLTATGAPHPRNSGEPLLHGTAASSNNQPFSSNFRQSNNAHNNQGAFGGRGNLVSSTTQSRRTGQDIPTSEFGRSQIPPFQPAPLRTPMPRLNAHSPAAQQGQDQIQGNRSHSVPSGAEADVDSEHYIYPDQAGAAVGGIVAQSSQLMRQRKSLQEELIELPGWCPDVNGDNIQQIMSDYLHQDGAFIIWKSRRHNKFVITVSHQANLIYLLVKELPPRSRDGGPVYYLFEEDSFRTDSILALYKHYRSHGIQMNITSQQGRQHREHVYLRGPIRVRITRRRRQ